MQVRPGIWKDKKGKLFRHEKKAAPRKEGNSDTLKILKDYMRRPDIMQKVKPELN